MEIKSPSKSEKEEWRDIPGYEGAYEASTLGRIRTKAGKTTANARYAKRVWRSRIMKGRGKAASGYRVSLWKDGVQKEYLVARLVATTFFGHPADDETVNHKDGNRFNNRLDNLEWLTIGDNIRYGFEHGQFARVQKPVEIRKGSEVIRFCSMAECDRFLGKSSGYTSERLARGKNTVRGGAGEYEIV